MINDRVAKLLQSDKVDFQDLQKFNEQEKKETYELAYAFYSSREYIKASWLFINLTVADPLIDCFWRGLASCKQLLKEYKTAIKAWESVCQLQPKDPFGYFHMAECYISMENKKTALLYLDQAENLCLNNSFLKNRIQLLKSIHGNLNDRNTA